MAITIPEAETPFSLVEQPRLNPNAPTIGDGVGALADKFIEIKARKVQAEQDRMVREARLSALEGLDEMRFRYETDANLDGLTDRWEAESNAYTQKVAANLPAHLRKDFELGMRETVAPQTSAIRRREFALFQDRELAALNADLRRVERSAAGAPDDAARNAIYLDAGDMIGRAVQSGLISAVEGDRMMAAIPENAEGIAIMQMAEESPEDAIAALKDPSQYTFLSGEARAKWLMVAKSNADQAAAQKTREDAMLAKQADAELSAAVDDATTLLDGGLQVKNLPELLDQARGTPHYDRLISAVDGSGRSANFARLPPADQLAEIAAMNQNPSGDPADVGRRNRMIEINQRTVEGLEKDRLGFVERQGILPLGQVDLANPATIRTRIAAAETIHRDYTPQSSQLVYFTQAEAEQYASVLSGPDTNAAMGVLAAITDGFGDRAPLALAQIGAKDATAQLAGALIIETGDPTTARTLLEGRRLRQQNQGAAISAEVVREVQAEMAPAFRGQPDRLNNLMAAAQDYAAAAAMGIADPKGEDAKAALRSAAVAVSGGTSRGGVQYGGVQEVHGQQSILPADLSAGEVERALGAFPAELWSGASLSGGLPKGFENWEGRRDSWVVLPPPASARAPAGTYALGVRLADGSLSYLEDGGTKTGVFLFNLHRLVKGVP